MQLKHFFVFLLILILSVADSSIYAQPSSSSYYQSSKSYQHKSFSAKNTKYIVFNKTNSYHNYLTFFFTSIHITSAFENSTLLTLKLQKQLYQQIALSYKKHTFLIPKITSNNLVSTLYSA